RGTASHGEQKGMAYGADLVGIGTGDGLSVFTALEGFNWLLENRTKYGIRVVNNSYGTGFTPFDPMHPLALATRRTTDAGVVVVSTRSNTTIVPLTGAPEDAKNIPPNELPYYTTLSGTSMASPETAGVVALVLEANPALTPAQVRMVLQITARPIPATPF